MLRIYLSFVNNTCKYAKKLGYETELLRVMFEGEVDRYIFIEVAKQGLLVPDSSLDVTLSVSFILTSWYTMEVF